jgi:hypothetical protein
MLIGGVITGLDHDPPPGRERWDHSHFAGFGYKF